MLGKQIHMKMRILLLAVLGLLGCGTAMANTHSYNPCANVNSNSNITGLDESETVTTTNPDPYENYNRHAYKFNTAIDKVIIRPVARVYQAVVPSPIAKG